MKFQIDGDELDCGLPLISVVIPFGGGEFLLEAVRSILEQTYRHIEVIVIDDFSQENAREVLLGVSDNRLKVFRTANKVGISRALNLGVRQSTGSYIARMDADDFALPERLNRQLHFMVANPSVVACGTAIETFGLRSRRFRFPSSNFWCRAMLTYLPCFAHPSVMFRRSSFEESGGYDSQFDGAEDYELWLRMMEKGELANLGEILLAYRVHDAQATRTKALLTRLMRKRVSLIARTGSDGRYRPHERFTLPSVHKTLGLLPRWAFRLQASLPVRLRKKSTPGEAFRTLPPKTNS